MFFYVYHLLAVFTGLLLFQHRDLVSDEVKKQLEEQFKKKLEADRRKKEEAERRVSFKYSLFSYLIVLLLTGCEREKVLN